MIITQGTPELYIGSALETTALTPNVANEITGKEAWTAQQGTVIGLTNRLLFNIKLYDSAGAEIDGSTKVHVYHSIPGLPLAPLGYFTYQPFRQVTAANQGDSQYQQSLWQYLTTGADVRGGESIVIKFEGPTVIDPTQTGTLLSVIAGAGVGVER